MDGLCLVAAGDGVGLLFVCRGALLGFLVYLSGLRRLWADFIAWLAVVTIVSPQGYGR